MRDACTDAVQALRTLGVIISQKTMAPAGGDRSHADGDGLGGLSGDFLRRFQNDGDPRRRK